MTYCEVTTACIEMTSSLEQQAPPPVGRAEFALVVFALVGITAMLIQTWRRG